MRWWWWDAVVMVGCCGGGGMLWWWWDAVVMVRCCGGGGMLWWWCMDLGDTFIEVPQVLSIANSEFSSEKIAWRDVCGYGQWWCKYGVENQLNNMTTVESSALTINGGCESPNFKSVAQSYVLPSYPLVPTEASIILFSRCSTPWSWLTGVEAYPPS